MSLQAPVSAKMWQVNPQRGQALVFTLVFTAAAGLVGLLLFNSGMLANTKTQLQNAADAGAYSASVLQARDHNFSAYTNRAMIANQVAVAQLVSLKSFIEDAKDTHDRMNGKWLGFWEAFPTSKPLWTFQKKSPAIDIADAAFSPVAGPAVAALDKLIYAFEAAQEAHHAATLADMVTVSDEVIKRNDPLAKLSSGVFAVGNLAVKLAAWDGYTKRHSANDTSKEADRFADVVVSANSTDSFTRNRASILPLPAAWSSSVSPTICWRGSIGIVTYITSSTSFGFIHSGGTLLSENKKRWLALDSTMGGGAWSCTYLIYYIVGAKKVTIGTPIFDAIGNSGFSPGGSGGAVAGAGGDYATSFGYKNNPALTGLYGGGMLLPPGLVRRYSMGPGSTLDSGGGLQNYYRDVANPLTSKPKDQTPEENGGSASISIEVERTSASIRTASKFLPGSSIIKLNDKLASNTMRTMSSAQAYFYRSKFDDLSSFTRSGWKRGDGKAELANLLNPYWQARLVDRTEIERGLSLADQMK